MYQLKTVNHTLLKLSVKTQKRNRGSQLIYTSSQIKACDQYSRSFIHTCFIYWLKKLMFELKTFVQGIIGSVIHFILIYSYRTVSFELSWAFETLNFSYIFWKNMRDPDCYNAPGRNTRIRYVIIYLQHEQQNHNVVGSFSCKIINFSVLLCMSIMHVQYRRCILTESAINLQIHFFTG